MILLLHILIALASLVTVTWSILRPQSKGLSVTYGLTAATIASGTLLVLITQASLLHVCMSGLVYLAVVLTGITVARRRLAEVTTL